MILASSYKQVLLSLGTYAVPVFVFLAIWIPLIYSFYVPGIRVTEEMTDTARYVPSDSVLDQIAEFFQSTLPDRNELVAKAEAILVDDIPPSELASGKTKTSLDVNLIKNTAPITEFSLALLKSPRLLLDAYELTKRDDFFFAARDMILTFASEERRAWLPKGYLWNDHAIAARISVLAKFWKFYRQHPDYEAEVAETIFRMVGRSAQFLAKPGHFTFATNHGIMQNLALWQICLAFPTLPNLEFYKQLAFERMRDQMIFYVNDEGVVLEHSAGYQRAGLRFMGMAFSYLTLLDMPIPDEWKVKYAKAKDFYTQLTRPDGSLPMFGDTGSGRKSSEPNDAKGNDSDKSDRLVRNKDWMQKRPYSQYPVAGYSIWWDGLDKWPDEENLMQTVVVWSNFPGHAHKHADEMSVLLWAGGQTWWTNVGYWPYGAKGRSEAVSWSGSNAPHLLGESKNSVRQTKLKYYGFLDRMAVIDLERKGPRDYIARRQLIQLKPNLWIVIDHFSGNENDQNVITWTTASDVRLSQGQVPGSYVLETERERTRLTGFILVSGGAEIKQFKGSFSPFAGWEITQPASAIRVVQPANDSWTVAVWSLDNDVNRHSAFNGPLSMKEWSGPENWKILLPVASIAMEISREGNRVFVSSDKKGAASCEEITLSEAPKIKDELGAIYQGYQNVEKKYPRKKYSMHRHIKATYLLLVLFLLQETFFFVYGRLDRKYYRVLRGLTSFGWIATGIWIMRAYL